jgi:hypothetical protein
MGAHKRTADEHLPNGSVIYWSRREDPYVPVLCGSCKRERMIKFENTTRETFDGICRQCTNGEKWQDESLPNGSVIYWSRREEQNVPVRCGKCGEEHMAHAGNIRKDTFTGQCRSCLHTGPSSTTWRGGRVDKHGYIYVKVYPDNPFYDSMANNMGYIAEHRLVMAQHLGRPLKRTEVVHHRNGDKTDNRIENLELYVSMSEHWKAIQTNAPHPGYVSAKKLIKAVEMVKRILEKEDI